MLTSNRGSQHLWFASPLGPGDDTGWHLLATHPTIDARIARLAELNPAGVEKAVAGSAPVANRPPSSRPPPTAPGRAI